MPVAVIGGGNTAVEEALYLSHLASKVTLVHRRERLRAEKILQDRLFKTANIEVIWDNVVEEICGTEENGPTRVTHVLGTRKPAFTSSFPPTVCLWPSAIRQRPSFFSARLMRSPTAILIPAPLTATNVPASAAGDVTDDIYRQAVTAAGLGCMAAIEAERWLAVKAHHRAAAE